jgi:hypothetical protein
MNDNEKYNETDHQEYLVGFKKKLDLGKIETRELRDYIPRISQFLRPEKYPAKHKKMESDKYHPDLPDRIEKSVKHLPLHSQNAEPAEREASCCGSDPCGSVRSTNYSA